MLNETIIEGIPTNIEYLKFALEYLKMNGYQFDSESCKQIDALYYEKLMNRPEKEANQHLRML